MRVLWRLQSGQLFVDEIGERGFREVDIGIVYVVHGVHFGTISRWDHGYKLSGCVAFHFRGHVEVRGVDYTVAEAIGHGL